MGAMASALVDVVAVASVMFVCFSHVVASAMLPLGLVRQCTRVGAGMGDWQPYGRWYW